MDDFKKTLSEDLKKYLQSIGRLDERMPECPDVEELWPSVAEAYTPDGVREFKDYPLVSLGWIMFVGMALAVYWDTDWERYSKESGAELYRKLRDAEGFDNLDDYVLKTVLHPDEKEADEVSKMVGECAARTLSLIQHSGAEAGTPVALQVYMDALRELYVYGCATELNALGYHMTPLGQ